MSEAQVTWLTQEAYDRLQDELAERSGPRRQEIAGYHAAKEEQGKNEARVRQLKALLEQAQIGAPESAHDEVAHGKVVTVRFVAFDETETFLLGSREEAAHASIEVYSPTSPLGSSLLGRRVGETTSYEANGRVIEVEIVTVEVYGS